jgi:hypothetical protein
VPWKPSVSAGLVKCGRCGKRYNNPLTHVCVARMDRKTKPTRLKPQVRATLIQCGKCGKSYTNPLTHTCVTRLTRKQKNILAKRRKPAPKPARKPAAKPAHNYRVCRDSDCHRPPCQAYREGYDDGLRDGAA